MSDLSDLYQKLCLLETLCDGKDRGCVEFEATKSRLQEAEAALKSIENQADKWIGDCCGTHADRFCENFGCVTMRTLTAPVRVYFQKWEKK